LREADADWLATVVTGVVESQRAIDRRVDQSLAATWPLARIDLTLRAVLRAATFEMEKRADVPAAVVISEYLDVARAFFDGAAPGIVNAGLARIAREVRPGERAERPGAGGPQSGPGAGAGEEP
jgi:N utilization substance protein B